MVSIVDARSSRSSLEASILVILFCRFREKKTHVATTSGVCPTPPIDRSIGAGRFRVHRRSHSIPFRARRFRDRFLVSPTVVFRRVPQKQTVDADGLLTRTCLHVPVARWAGGCLRERHEEDWRVIVPAVIRRSRARRGTLPRASPSLRDPHATGSGRASVRGSSGSRTARLESVRRFEKLEADCASRQEGALHVGHRATCFRPWCGGTPPRVGNRPARRGSRRGKRLPMAFRIPRATPAPKRDSEPRDPRAPPEESRIRPHWQQRTRVAFDAFREFRNLTPPQDATARRRRRGDRRRVDGVLRRQRPLEPRAFLARPRALHSVSSGARSAQRGRVVR